MSNFDDLDDKFIPNFGFSEYNNDNQEEICRGYGLATNNNEIESFGLSNKSSKKFNNQNVEPDLDTTNSLSNKKKSIDTSFNMDYLDSISLANTNFSLPKDNTYLHGENSNDQADFFDNNIDYESDQGPELLSNIANPPPEMSSEFYAEVDLFLKKPPPKFNIDNVPIKKKDKDQKKKKSSTPELPPINNQNGNIVRQHEISNQSDSKTVKKKNSQQVISQIDKDRLLEEAFAYSNKLLELSMQQEKEKEIEVMREKEIEKKNEFILKQQANQQALNTISSKISKNSSTNSSTKKKGSSNVSTIRNLKSSKSSSSITSSSSNPSSQADFVVSQEAEKSLYKQAINYDQLIKNFEEGQTLGKLRKELEESQKALAYSQGAIRSISQQFINK